MKEFTVSKAKVLNEDLYCDHCGAWVYCTEMNSKAENEDGGIIEQIGDGCLHQSAKGDFLECPDCKSRFYVGE